MWERACVFACGGELQQQTSLNLRVREGGEGTEKGKKFLRRIKKNHIPKWSVYGSELTIPIANCKGFKYLDI